MSMIFERTVLLVVLKKDFYGIVFVSDLTKPSYVSKLSNITSIGLW